MFVSDRKLVSVITGTYNRPYSLKQCIEYVQAQTYPNIEHCIVHDGPASEDVKNVIGCAQLNIIQNDSNKFIKFRETGRQWSQFLANSISAVPFQVAQWVASGDYICWFADDETMTPEHIEKLVNLLEEKDVDFVYPQSECWWANIEGVIRSPSIIGKYTPVNGQITTVLARVELLDYRGFMTHVGSGTDWDQIDSWMKAGASWAFLPEVTHTHRIDKNGDRGLNTTKQILKGHSNGK